jgi:hypothetical protein
MFIGNVTVGRILQHTGFTAYFGFFHQVFWQASSFSPTIILSERCKILVNGKNFYKF